MAAKTSWHRYGTTITYATFFISFFLFGTADIVCMRGAVGFCCKFTGESVSEKISKIGRELTKLPP